MVEEIGFGRWGRFGIDGVSVGRDELDHVFLFTLTSCPSDVSLVEVIFGTAHVGGYV